MSGAGHLIGLACAATLLGTSLSAAAATGTLDLAHCAAIDAPDARLACYDALAGRAPARPADARAVAVAPPPARAPATAAAGATAAPTAAAGPQNFGLSQVQRHEAPTEPDSVQAMVAGVSTDAGGHAYVVLDNGQTWGFTETESDSRLRPGDAVTIRRASLGSFLMVTPSRHSYRVHRTR